VNGRFSGQLEDLAGRKTRGPHQQVCKIVHRGRDYTPGCGHQTRVRENFDAISWPDVRDGVAAASDGYGRGLRGTNPNTSFIASAYS
jgi:hypothetical protein